MKKLANGYKVLSRGSLTSSKVLIMVSLITLIIRADVFNEHTHIVKTENS